MKLRAFANTDSTNKNPLRSTSWDYLCMHEGKKGKKISQKLIRVQLFLWWWHRSDTSACTACLGWRFSSLPSALHQEQSTEHAGMWGLFGFSQNEFGFPKWPCVSLYLLTFPLFCVLYKKTLKKQTRKVSHKFCMNSLHWESKMEQGIFHRWSKFIIS